MATTAGGPRASGGITPAALATLLLHPHRGWARIARSHAGIGSVMLGLAVPLAAIRSGAWMAHGLLYGDGRMGIIEYRPTLAGALGSAVVGWLISLAVLILVALLLARLAPRFGGRPDLDAAFRLVVVASVPFFLAALLALVPAIAIIRVVGFYTLFLLAVGAPRLLGVPGERSVAFGGLAAGAALALAIAGIVASSAVLHHNLRPTVETADGRKVVTGVPGIAESKLSAPATSKKNAVAPGTAVAAAGGAVPASALQQLLPAQIGAFRRTALQSQSNLSAGIASASAQGTYVSGTNSYTLTITDAGQPGALAITNSVIGGEINRVSDHGYQFSRVVDGVRVTEKWNNPDHGGSYSRTVAARFTVEAQGTAPDIQTLRAAVGSVDRARLAAMAH